MLRVISVRHVVCILLIFLAGLGGCKSRFGGGASDNASNIYSRARSVIA